MKDIVVPAMGESVTEAIIAEWLKGDGDYVNRNETIVVLESDKANFEVVAEAAGALRRGAEEGDTVAVGAVIGTIDPSAEAPAGGSEEKVAPQPAGSEEVAPSQTKEPSAAHDTSDLSPAVRRVVEEKGLDPSQIKGTGPGGRLTKEDVLNASSPPPASPAPTESSPLPQMSGVSREVRRVKMPTLRKRIAERLVSAQHTAAILSTFNEIDMGALLQLRASYKDAFKEKHGVSLGFMGIFTKAVCEALKFVPDVGAFIEGDEVVYNEASHVGVAVGTEKGLVVPVIKDADLMSVAEIELAIRHFALKARDGKISVDDMQGGNFTISNGGVYGSLMSTPILNPPQSGILGMHKIEERPMAINGEVVIRPMMYVALSYDHRLIDGKGAVTFLVKVKEFVEDPSRLLLGI